MPVVLPQGGQRRGPHWTDKMKMGMLMGGTVGGIMGFIYGTMTIFQQGAGQAGVMRTLGKYMLASGGFFGLFMGVGSLIRNDSPMTAEMWARSLHPPIIHPRRPPRSFHR